MSAVSVRIGSIWPVSTRSLNSSSRADHRQSKAPFFSRLIFCVEVPINMGKHRPPSKRKAAVKACPRKVKVTYTAASPESSQRIEIRRNDVVFGRGPTICALEGNLRYRSFVCQFKEKYQSAKKMQKQRYIDKVIEKVHALDPPGRFLEAHGDSLREVSSMGRVYEKISQALRDKKNCDPSSFLQTYRKIQKVSKLAVVSEAGSDNDSIASEDTIVMEEVKSAVVNKPSRQSHRARRAVWPPPLTDKESGRNLKARDDVTEIQQHAKTTKKHDVGIADGTRTSRLKEKTTNQTPKPLPRITIRCGEWSATYPSDGREDAFVSLSMCPNAEAPTMPADEVMNDDSIWSGAAAFELLQFPTESENIESRSGYLELEAAEIVPAAEKSTLNTDCVTIEPDLGVCSKNSDGGSLLDGAEAIPEFGNSKSIDRLISEWGEDTADLLDFSGGFAQVFSSEFESEVSTMIPKHGEEGDCFKKSKDQSPPQVIPRGIAFMCATSSVFFSGDIKQPTNHRPDARVKTLEGPGNMTGQYSLFELAFKDRVDALEAAKKCLIAM